MRSRDIHKWGIIGVLALCSSAYCVAQDGSDLPNVHPDRDRYPITLKTWEFHKGDVDDATMTDTPTTEWISLDVPHTWNTDLINGTTYYLGIGWYRRSLNVTQSMLEKRLFIRFKGANTVADVYVNGEHAGQHRGGYSAFCFEISDFVTEGENLITVKVDNAYNSDITPVAGNLFTRFGGIYRPVSVIVTDPVCITPLDYASPGVYLLQRNVSKESADLEVLTKVSNGGTTDAIRTVAATITDAKGNVIKTLQKEVSVKPDETLDVKQSCTLIQPHLWNSKQDPYLYQVTVQILDGEKLCDSIKQPLGFRSFYVDPNKGFFLNGKYIDLYGVNRHQEWEQEGSALTDLHHRKDVDFIMEIGANALRLAHYQQADLMYELCNNNGLIVWAEAPITPPYQKDNPKYKENCRQQIIELIRQNFNHPSILFWSIYNEVNIPDEDTQELHDLVKREDPSRLSAAGSCAALQNRHTINDVIAWNKYPHWYGGPAISKFAAAVHKRYPTMCVGISEYGAGGCADQHQQNPRRPNPTSGRFFPEEYQAIAHEKIWEDMRDQPEVWCKFIWNMFDFSWPPVNRGNRQHMNHKGLVTYDRQFKKDAFHFYKANWNKDTALLHITSRRHVERKHEMTDVKVYSTAKAVELFVNGESHGMQPCDSLCRSIWTDIELEEGKNTITVQAVINGQPLKDQCVWTYEPQTVLSSASDSEAGNVPENATDGSLNTRWGSGEQDPWWQLQLKKPRTLSSVEIAWYKSNERIFPFEIEVSLDGSTWKQIFAGESSGKHKGYEAYTFPEVEATYLRINCHGSSKSIWSSFWEVKIEDE